MKLLTYFIISLASLLALSTISAQEMEMEMETEMGFDALRIQRYELEKTFPDRSAERGGGALELPFTDDFSKYSLPTDDPEIPLSWQRWEGEHAYLNFSFGELPPTLGVATLDGLMGDGYPWNFIIPDLYGPADTLLSLPINLAPFDTLDNVYLTFFYQAGGFGNEPEPQDSLVLEFYISDIDAWENVWSVPGQENGAFQQAFVRLDKAYFFEADFRFRFTNWATLSGCVDHWNIDYVVLDENIDPETFEIVDVGFVYPVHTLLTEGRTSMPWTHFTPNPASYMKENFLARQFNLNEDRNITSGYKVEYEGALEGDFQGIYINTTGNGFSQFESDFEVNSAPVDYVYDESVNDTCAFFDIEILTNTTPDGNRNNDTTYVRQEFTNFYAYDDGSAERAYALNQAGGKLALQYDVEEGDSLLGLFMHFVPLVDDVSNEDFLIRVWGDDAGIPGTEIGVNFEFQEVSYYQNGYNIFKFYEYDDPIYVEGRIYVGWVQNSNAKLNIGNDKNTDTNTSRLFFQLGTQGEWTQSGIPGSVMIRPVFQSGKSGVWNGVEEKSIEASLYPNPVNHSLNILWQDIPMAYDVGIYDLSGKAVLLSENQHGNSSLSLDHLSPGLYLVFIRNRNGEILLKKKIQKF